MNSCFSFHHQYQKEIEKKIAVASAGTDNDGDDWFSAAVARHSERQEVHQFRAAQLQIQKQEARISALKERRKGIQVIAEVLV